jgi:hypothetical protein
MAISKIEDISDIARDRYDHDDERIEKMRGRSYCC